MSQLEFNSDGSIKMPDSVIKDKEKTRKSIILEKHQVSAKNPAIAQLRIKLGPDLNGDREQLIKKIYNFCERFIQSNSAKVDSGIKLQGETVIVEARSSMMMYSFLENLIIDFREVYGAYAEYGEKYNVSVCGSWGK